MRRKTVYRKTKTQVSVEKSLWRRTNSYFLEPNMEIIYTSCYGGFRQGYIKDIFEQGFFYPRQTSCNYLYVETCIVVYDTIELRHLTTLKRAERAYPTGKYFDPEKRESYYKQR